MGALITERISRSIARKMGESFPSQALFWKDWAERYLDKVMCGSATTACLAAKAALYIRALQVISSLQNKISVAGPGYSPFAGCFISTVLVVSFYKG